MTARELIATLQSLPDDALDLTVLIESCEFPGLHKCGPPMVERDVEEVSQLTGRKWTESRVVLYIKQG